MKVSSTTRGRARTTLANQIWATAIEGELSDAREKKHGQKGWEQRSERYRNGADGARNPVRQPDTQGETQAEPKQQVIVRSNHIRPPAKRQAPAPPRPDDSATENDRPRGIGSGVRDEPSAIAVRGAAPATTYGSPIGNTESGTGPGTGRQRVVHRPCRESATNTGAPDLDSSAGQAGATSAAKQSGR